MDDTGRRARKRPGRPWTVRTRVLALMLALMVTGLLVAGAVTFSVQFAELNERVEQDLAQEVGELGSLAASGPEGVASDGGGAPYTNLDELFYAYLQGSVPGRFESVLTLIDGEPRFVSGGDRPFALDRPEVVAAALATHQEGRSVMTDLQLDDRSLWLMVASVQLPGETREGVFVVGIDVGSQRARLYHEMATYAVVALGTTVATGLAGHLVAGRLLRPLTELREATSAITAEDLTRRVEVSHADTDVAQLAVTFNQMLDRIEAGIADQRQFLDDAAHELRTPLTIIRGNLELVAADDPGDVDQTRELVLDEVDRMQRLVDDLLLLAKAQRPDFVRPAPVEVSALAEELMDRVHLLGGPALGPGRDPHRPGACRPAAAAAGGRPAGRQRREVQPARGHGDRGPVLVVAGHRGAQAGTGGGRALPGGQRAGHRCGHRAGAGRANLRAVRAG